MPKKQATSADDVSLKLWLFLSSLLLLAFALRVYHLDYQSLWRDEVDAIRFSSWSLIDLVQGLVQRGHNGPLYFLVLRGWRALTGNSEFALRYFSVLGGILNIPLTYQVGRCLGTTKFTAGLAVILMATSPYLIWYSQEAKMYTWLVTLILMAIYAHQTALKMKPGHILWWGIFITFTSLSFYTHILAPLMLTVYITWAGLQWSLVKKHQTYWLVSLGVLTLPYLPLVLWQSSLFFEGTNSGHPFYTLPEMGSLLINFYSGGIFRTPYSLFLITGTGFLAIIGFGFYLTGLVTPKQRKLALFLATWLILPIVLVYLISLRVAVFEDRYLIYLTPTYYLLMALGLTMLTRFGRWSSAIILIVFVGFNIWATYRQANIKVKTDFREVANYIANTLNPPENSFDNVTDLIPDSYVFEQFLPLTLTSSPVVQPTKHEVQFGPHIMFQMPYLQYTFEYYFDQPYQPLGGVWTNNGQLPTEVAAEMAARTTGLNGLWLVVAEEEQWDSRRLTRQWLNDNAIIEYEEHFSYVSVYKYRFEE